MSIFLWRNILTLLLGFALSLSVTFGGCLFEKHFGNKLVESATKTSLIRQVGGVLECEILCYDNLDRCVAANLIFVKANVYRCELILELTENFNNNQLLPNPRGKFIRRTGPRKLTIISSLCSSNDNGYFKCDNAHDGELAPGRNKEWSAHRNDQTPWLRLDFSSVSLVAIIKIWHRCAGQAQFSELKLSFSDGSKQEVKLRCGTETSWLACDGDPEEVFYLSPVLTNYVNITGIDCQPLAGNNGFREVEIWSP